MRRLTGLAKWLRLAGEVFEKPAGPLSLRFVLHVLGTMRHEKLTVLDGHTIVNANTPPLESRAYRTAGQALARLARGESQLMSVCIAPTGRCPFNCFYCSSRTFGADVEMSTAKLIDLVGEVQAMGVSAIHVSGGEPLLREDLPEVIAAVDDRSMTALFTSGFNLPRMARALKQAGLTYVIVSLDTFDAAEYNRRRGHPNAFGIAVDAIRASVAEGFYTAVGMMPNEHMLAREHFDAFVHRAAELGVHEIRPLGPRACVALGRENTRLLNRRQVDRLFTFQKHYNRRAGMPTVLSLDYIERPHVQGCIGGNVYVYLTAAGDVTPCEFNPVSFGNVNDRPLRELHADMCRYIPHPTTLCPLIDVYRLLVDVPDEALPVRDSERVAEVYGRLDSGAQPLPAFWKNLGMPVGSTDAGKLFTKGHVDDASAAESCT